VPVLLALVAAALIGTGLSLQHRAASAEEAHAALDPRLLLRLVRRATWVLGMLVGFAGFAFEAMAIGSGRLVLVEPIMACSVLVALLLSARHARRPLGRREWRGVVATIVGVGAFLVVASPLEGEDPSPVVPWIVPIGTFGGLVLLGALLARRLPSERRGVLLAALAGVGFGTASSLIKLITDVADAGGAGDIPGHWSLYAWMVVSPLAFLLQQSALHATHLGAALPATSTLSPSTSCILGALMFGEQIRGGWAVPAEVVLVALMLYGVATLASSPLIDADADPSVVTSP
jgi:drug/metabolite transporter (DMT)-like permease